MAEESDWELVSDSEHSDPLTKVRVDFPPTGAFPNQETTSEASQKVSANSVYSFNSFSIVGGFDALGVQSESESYSSSYVHPSSNDSSCCVGSSICGQFDLISLSSGEVFFRCRDCKARNPVGTGICSICGLAQVANPCIEVDNQVAVAQQQREDRMALERLEFEERQLENLMDESLLNKATYLATKLAVQLEAHDSIIQEFQEIDLVNRTSVFLEKAYELLQRRAFAAIANLNLAGGYVVIDQAEEMLVQVRGFGSGTNIRISRTVEDALRQGQQSASKQGHYASSNLSPISENDEMQRPPTSVWIVSVVGSGSNFSGNNRNFIVPRDTVLPLACLPTQDIESKTSVITSLTKVLWQIIDDTFTDGLHLKEPTIVQSHGFARKPKEMEVKSKSQSNTEIGHKRSISDQRWESKAEKEQKRINAGHRRSNAYRRREYMPESGRKRSPADHRWLSQKDSAPRVARKSTSMAVTTGSRVASTKPIQQDTIDANRENRFGILSFFIAGGSMEDLEGLNHDTRTSLRLCNVPSSIDAEWLLQEFSLQGFPAEKFNVFFLPMKPGYRPGFLFLDFADYKDIPQFCHAFCSVESKSGFHFQPQYTQNQGGVALAKYFERSPFEYCPFNNCM